MIRTVSGGAALAVLVGLGSASAQSPAEFYKGKTVTIIVSSAPGGGYDRSIDARGGFGREGTGLDFEVDGAEVGAGELGLGLQAKGQQNRGDEGESQPSQRILGTEVCMHEGAS